ncbi:MAG: type II/IV secretion system protein [Bradymonadaceae bacterium]|nr:type II/IV secretion system protein [Lujinxingiaceae bacterium]
MVVLGNNLGNQQLVQVRRGDDGQLHERTISTISLVPSLGDVLVDMGLVKAEGVSRAEALCASTGMGINQALLESANLEEHDLYRALALQRGLKLARVERLLEKVQTELLEAVPRAFLEHNQVVPVFKSGHRLAVATTDPDAELRHLAKALDAREIDLFLLTPTDYRRLWKALDLGQLITASTPGEGAEKSGKNDMLEQGASAFDARIVTIFEAMLLDAIGERASDIHLERYDEEVRLRFRIDGELLDQSRYQLSPTDLLALVNVIKVSASMDIAERRLPQGGRMRRRAGTATYDMRVQTQPSLHGEHVVIRLLPQDTRPMTIEDLGFPEVIARQYKRLIDSPAGMVLVVGPTGSGKSTTLYAALNILAQDARRKVITVEDPIEYAIRGVQQTQVRPRIGFAFADAMRSFVRQDPDVILVGEIRDQETALEAIRASQTGHLVLSTLHSNDAVDAVQRLFDLGMHPNSIASELIGIIAQRLAKRICASCREPAPLQPEIVAELFPQGTPPSFRAFRGRGCSRCAGRGTRGRIAVIEFLRVTATVRRAISRQMQVDELREHCLDSGLFTLRDTSVLLVQNGLIPLDDLPRFLPAERMAPEHQHPNTICLRLRCPRLRKSWRSRRARPHRARCALRPDCCAPARCAWRR